MDSRPNRSNRAAFSSFYRVLKCTASKGKQQERKGLKIKKPWLNVAELQGKKGPG